MPSGYLVPNRFGTQGGTVAQRTVFPLLPNVDDAHYLVKLNRVLFFVDEERPKLKDLRSYNFV